MADNKLFAQSKDRRESSVVNDGVQTNISSIAQQRHSLVTVHKPIGHEQDGRGLVPRQMRSIK